MLELKEKSVNSLFIRELTDLLCGPTWAFEVFLCAIECNTQNADMAVYWVIRYLCNNREITQNTIK